MVQPHRIKKFKTKDGDEMPFKEGEGGLGPSGSRWTTKELNWLAVHFQDKCDVEDVFSAGTVLSGQIAKSIRSKLRADEPDWNKLRKIRFSAAHFYSRLFFLETKEEKQQYYSPSAGTSTQASSAQKDQRSPSESSESSSAYHEQLSLTPTPRPVPLKMHEKSENLATGSSPLGPKPSKPPNVRNDTRAGKRAPPKKIRMKNLFGVKGSTKPWSEGTNRRINPSSLVSVTHATAPAGPPTKSLPKGVTFLAVDYPSWETSSDTTFTAHSSQSSVSESDSYDEEQGEEEEEEDDEYDAVDDKHENDVVSAAQAFLCLISDAFKSVVQELPLTVRNPRKLDLPIEGVSMTSHPDLSLRLGTIGNDTLKKDPEIELVVECKRKINKLSANRKLGQEFSQLLGDVKRQWAYGKPRDTYRAFLISWHHLECYISRLDISKEYLDKLDNNTTRLQEGPHPLVKRSRRFDLTKSDHRVQFAMLAAHLLIHQMTIYKRHKELVERLLG